MSWFRKKMWLAVEDGWAGWIDTPNSGADASPTGWSTSGTYLNGGGFATHSWGTHKRYTFEWSDASTRQQAQFMQSLRSGIYGKGLIHFIEPTLYDTNILPARIAAPSISLDDGGRSLVIGSDPVLVPATGYDSYLLPQMGVRWDLGWRSIAGYPGNDWTTFIPVPDGFSLAVGAVYSRTGTGGVFISSGGVRTRLKETSPNSTGLIPVENIFSGNRVARLWIGRDDDTDSSVTVYGIVARLIPTDKIWGAPASVTPIYTTFEPGVFGDGTFGDGRFGIAKVIETPGEPVIANYGALPYGQGPYGGVPTTAAWKNLARSPWVGGMGNTGCRFDGTPTLVHNTGVNGGQVGYAASFIEVGAYN